MRSARSRDVSTAIQWAVRLKTPPVTLKVEDGLQRRERLKSDMRSLKIDLCRTAG